MYISSEKISYYAKNKPYMVGLNKLLPLPQCVNRWTDEQKTILSNIKKIEEQLKDCDVTISESEFINIVKNVLTKANVKHGVTCQLCDTEVKKDTKGFTHTYNTYRYLLNIIDENYDIIDRKDILTVIKIDEPTPFLSGSNRNFKLSDLLKNENTLKTIKEYPQVAEEVANKVNKKETKREL